MSDDFVSVSLGARLHVDQIAAKARAHDLDDLSSHDLEQASTMLYWKEAERKIVLDEWQERFSTHRYGIPGRAAMLSQAQCRAVLGPLLKAFDEEMLVAAKIEGLEGVRRCYKAFGSKAAIHASARALLNLGPGEKSPLEED